MIYLIEFALLHTLFYIVYRLMLVKETELRFLRGFLIGSTILSLIVPMLSIPNAPLPTVNTEAIILPAFSTVQQDEATQSYPSILTILFGAGFLILLKIVWTLFQLLRFYRQSEPSEVENIAVREVSGLQNSFTFFKWIFIDTHFFEAPKDIVRHEHGHVKKLTRLTCFFSMSYLSFSGGCLRFG